MKGIKFMRGRKNYWWYPASREVRDAKGYLVAVECFNLQQGRDAVDKYQANERAIAKNREGY